MLFRSRLDMESHCVLIVGYNDDKEEFDIVDPWNPNWGGQHGGVGKLPYESLHVACVNCTAEKGTRLSLISHKIRPVLIEENASLAVDLGFYEPLGYVIDRNNTKFETFKVTIHYLFNGNEKQQSQSLSGEWKFGEKAIFATVYKGNIIKNLIMDCQSYTKYRPNETTGGIFVSWRRKEELPTGA